MFSVDFCNLSSPPRRLLRPLPGGDGRLRDGLWRRQEDQNVGGRSSMLTVTIYLLGRIYCCGSCVHITPTVGPCPAVSKFQPVQVDVGRSVWCIRAVAPRTHSCSVSNVLQVEYTAVFARLAAHPVDVPSDLGVRQMVNQCR